MKLTNGRMTAIGIGLLTVVWCIGIYAAAGLFEPELTCAGGITYGLISAALALVYLLLIRRPDERQAVEATAVSLYITTVYTVVALVVNTAFILTEHGDFNRFMLLCNAAVTAVAIVLILLAEKDSKRLSDQLARTAEKTTPSADISGKLGVLLGITQDQEIRGRLLKLKESVDYTTNISTRDSLLSEQRMANQLDELTGLILDQKSPDEIRAKLQQAETTWKIRTAASAAGR